MKDKISKIKLLAMDVDGVLTDGKIIYDSQGNEIKQFDAQDGFAIVLFRKSGFKTAIITGRTSKVVAKRAKDLKIDKIYQKAEPKINAYMDLLKKFKLKDENVCYIGDDLPDLSIVRRVGFSVSVSNAVQEIKRSSHYITKNPGGSGAVREVVELILKSQTKWFKIIERYK